MIIILINWGKNNAPYIIITNFLIHKAKEIIENTNKLSQEIFYILILFIGDIQNDKSKFFIFYCDYFLHDL